MAYINLLPWREGQRLKQKKEYLGLLGLVALVVFGLFWFIGMGVDSLIDNQRFRNAYLQREIDALDKQIVQIKEIKSRKNAIEQQMALIEQLQASRNVAPHILNELANLVPAGVSFKSFVRTKNKIELEGQSESNNRLAEFMRQLQNSTVFDREDLSSIVSNTGNAGAVSDFKLTFFISHSVSPEIVVAEEPKK
ncbi:PilN domain-containing protein [Neptunicella sp. SCSIO 80796]|uniref:PilN domain-containing protein n=1 Tax=Neptunicella plasticusilytica TaxID=3117012 RepID=UPI003A4D782F